MYSYLMKISMSLFFELYNCVVLNSPVLPWQAKAGSPDPALSADRQNFFASDFYFLSVPIDFLLTCPAPPKVDKFDGLNRLYCFLEFSIKPIMRFSVLMSYCKYFNKIFVKSINYIIRKNIYNCFSCMLSIFSKTLWIIPYN